MRDSIDRDVYKSYDCVFYRLVHLDKLRLATRREESEVLFDAGGKDPDIIVKAASESKGGVIEKLIKVDEDSALFYLLQKTLSRPVLSAGMSSVMELVSSFSMIVIRQVVNDLVYFLKTINFLQL